MLSARSIYLKMIFFSTKYIWLGSVLAKSFATQPRAPITNHLYSRQNRQPVGKMSRD